MPGGIPTGPVSGANGTAQLLGSEQPGPELMEPPRTEDADLAHRVTRLEDEVARLWDALERREP
jgi:hypothetical protein